MTSATDSPFPGMDPYVEQHWRDVHHRLCTYSCDAIGSRIAPALVARLEERIVLETYEEPRPQVRYPDVHINERDPSTPVMAEGESGVGAALATATPPAVRIWRTRVPQAFIEIREAASGRLVTVIEFVSPSNKSKEGLAGYLRKQGELTSAGVSMVEIDLTRPGSSELHGVSENTIKRSAYRAVISLGWDTQGSDENYWSTLYDIHLRNKLPVLQVPLRKTDSAVGLDVQAVFSQAYRNGSYWATVDYSKPAVPPLAGEDAEWADQLLKSAGKR